MAEKVLSIEIGPNLTKVAETERKTGNVIHNAFYFETPEDTLENGVVKCNPQFQLRLEEGLKSKGIKTKKVIFVLQASNIGNKEEVMPKMKDAKIKEYIETNAGTFFPTSGEGYQFTYRNNGTTENDQMRAQLFAIPRNTIKAYEDLATFCKLSLVDLELVENGIAKTIREYYPLGIVASIDVESVCTYLTIVKNGDIMMQRMIPFGIDEALKALQDSELVKTAPKFDEVFDYTTEKTCFHKHLNEVEAGDEDDDYNLSSDDNSADNEIKDIMTDEVRFVIGNLSRFLDFYISHHSDEEIDKIIVSGLATYCKGFPDLLANELNRELISADSTLLKDIANKRGVKNAGIYLSTISAAGCADNSVIDKSSKKKGLTFDKSSLVRADDDFTLAKKILIGALIIGVVLVGAGVGLYIYFNHKVSDLQSDISKLQDAKQINDKMLTSKANYEAASNVDKLSEVANDDFITLLNELESALPVDVVVTSIEADSDAVTFEVQSASKPSIASLLSSVRNFSTVDIDDTIDIKSTTTDTGQVTYSSSVKCTYKSSKSDSSSSSSSSGSSSSSSSSSSNSTSSNTSSNSSSNSSNSSNSSSNTSANKTN